MQDSVGIEGLVLTRAGDPGGVFFSLAAEAGFVPSTGPDDDQTPKAKNSASRMPMSM